MARKKSKDQQEKKEQQAKKISLRHRARRFKNKTRKVYDFLPGGKFRIGSELWIRPTEKKNERRPAA